jgi:hypothetical protein
MRLSNPYDVLCRAQKTQHKYDLIPARSCDLIACFSHIAVMRQL